MNNRLLKEIISRIEISEGLTLSGIAMKANADRSYISKLINDEKEKEVGKRLLNKFKQAFPAYFHIEPQKQHVTNLNAVLEDLQLGQAAIIAEIRSYGQYLVMESADFDEKRYARAKALVDKIYYENLSVNAPGTSRSPAANSTHIMSSHNS